MCMVCMCVLCIVVPCSHTGDILCNSMDAAMHIACDVLLSNSKWLKNIMLNTTLRYLNYLLLLQLHMWTNALCAGVSASASSSQHAVPRCISTHVCENISYYHNDVHHYYHTDEFNLNCHVMEKSLNIHCRTKKRWANERRKILDRNKKPIAMNI